MFSIYVHVKNIIVYVCAFKTVGLHFVICGSLLESCINCVCLAAILGKNGKIINVVIHLFRVLQYNDCKVEGGGVGG